MCSWNAWAIICIISGFHVFMECDAVTVDSAYILCTVFFYTKQRIIILYNAGSMMFYKVVLSQLS